MVRSDQLMLFETEEAAASTPNSTTFIDNMKLPAHRWFRYSAGFSAQWAESLIKEQRKLNRDTRVLDPFAGSGTTLLASQDMGIESYGIESHPFVARIARAKLARHSDPKAYRLFARKVLKGARLRSGDGEGYAPLIKKCYTPEALAALDCIRTAYEHHRDTSAASELTWLTLLGILRKTSHVGTANWQYVLPKKSKKGAVPPFDAFEEQIDIVHHDMLSCQDRPSVMADLLEGDARTCDGVPDRFANLVITSPPYPNNYDYADATRLEMTFMGEIEGWGDLHDAVRKHLVVSCSQHVPEKAVDLSEVMKKPEIAPIRPELAEICGRLGEIRLSKGGKKTYHLMVACYFRDLARAWIALRRVCDTPCKVCFVLGDSAPDYVLEFGGSEDRNGPPKAFIETAWRRYTKHSRNKAQEMQGAIIPLAEKYREYRPYLGVLLAGVFTEGSIQQLRSHGFHILYFPYASIVSAFSKVGIDAAFDEDTPDSELQQKVEAYGALAKPRKRRITDALVVAHKQDIASFLTSLEMSLNRVIQRILVATLHGTSKEVASVEDAIKFVENYEETRTVAGFVRYEISVRYSNGDRIEGEFEDRQKALSFLASL